MKLKRLIIASMFVVATAGIAGSIVAHAAPTADSELTQEITAGALSTDIRDASGNVVVNPSFAMSSQTVSNAQQTSTGTFGDNARRVTVDNPGGANGGWTLSWNASTPGTGTWTSGTDTYAYNGDATTGQLTVNPATGTLVSSVGSSTGITLGTSAPFSGSAAINLITAAAGSDDIWNGYVTGISLSQIIPASQPAGSYTLDMTQTVATI